MAEDRRTILKVLTSVLGTGAAAAIAGPALQAVLSPLGKVTVSGSGGWVPVCNLEAVPEDGAPVNVQVVVAEPKDAWTKMPPTTVGAVFLMKKAGKVVAYSTVCPHLGCGIDYQPAASQFACPCHESAFDADGKVAAGPSPRGMDELETEIKDGAVHVRFVKFKIGSAEKVPA